MTTAKFQGSAIAAEVVALVPRENQVAETRIGIATEIRKDVEIKKELMIWRVTGLGLVKKVEVEREMIMTETKAAEREKGKRGG